MKKRSFHISGYAAFLTIVAMGVMAWVSISRLHLSSDMMASLPGGDASLEDTRRALTSYPFLERVTIDISTTHTEHASDILLKASKLVEKSIVDSTILRVVSPRRARSAFLSLIDATVDNLPGLFSEEMLQEHLAPMLRSARIQGALTKVMESLATLDGASASRWTTRDPLGFRNLILKRLRATVPSGVQIIDGHIFSADGLHLLLVAEPNPAYPRSQRNQAIEVLIREVCSKIEISAGLGDVRITSMGAYRASLDNERFAQGDARRAILIATVGIGILLIFFFKRRGLGLLSFLPAIFGTLLALFVLSVVKGSINVFSLGFGGGLISITVDHGIAYLLFLERPYVTTGRDASEEVWSVGFAASVTTVGAFSALILGGFPLLAEVGLFSALGVTFSFLFVHSVFPAVFRQVPGTLGEKTPDRASSGSLFRPKLRWALFVVTVLVGVIMLSHARPELSATLADINTMSPETLRAQSEIQKTWGNLLDRSYIVHEAGSLEKMRRQSDALGGLLEAEIGEGRLSHAFTLSFIAPGKESVRKNLDAWRRFWTPKRVAQVKADFARAVSHLGFSEDAFLPFFAELKKPHAHEIGISKSLYPILGIRHDPSTDRWSEAASIAFGQGASPNTLFIKLKDTKLGWLLNGSWFSKHLSEAMKTVFLRMLVVVVIGVLVILFLFFLDPLLASLAVLPLFFGGICTLGTLSLLGKTIGIPALMFATVVIGMGVDYALYFVRSSQRYLGQDEASMATIRKAVLLSGLSTLMGFGSLIFARHLFLKDVGLTMTLAIAYTLIGTFFLLPTLLRLTFRPRPFFLAVQERRRALVLRRYRHLDAKIRLTARFQVATDPLCEILPQWIEPESHILEIGPGWGVMGTWLLATIPGLRMTGLTPSSFSVRVCRHAWGEKGDAILGDYEDFPETLLPADIILMLDVVHRLDDDALERVLAAARQHLRSGAFLLLRTRIFSERRRVSLGAWIERLREKALRIPNYHRTSEDLRLRLLAGGWILEENTDIRDRRGEVSFLARVKAL